MTDEQIDFILSTLPGTTLKEKMNHIDLIRTCGGMNLFMDNYRDKATGNTAVEEINGMYVFTAIGDGMLDYLPKVFIEMIRVGHHKTYTTP